ncbi:MAG: hypothetical protein ABI563_13310 [Specibacter sp.]
MPALAEIVENCWVLVSTVYAWLSTQGPQPYLIGQGEGPYLLDSVRAVKALDAEQAELDMVPETIVGGTPKEARLCCGLVAWRPRTRRGCPSRGLPR